MLLHFLFVGKPFHDPEKVQWFVYSDPSKSYIQKGELNLPSAEGSKIFGSYRSLTWIPEIRTDHLTQTTDLNITCHNPKHMREYVWQLIQAWKKENEDLEIRVTGSCLSWTHLWHKMIHDDEKNRKTFELDDHIDLVMRPKKNFESI